MPTNVEFPSLKDYKTAAKEAFSEVLREELPKVVREATRKDYYTTNDLKEKFGFSSRKQQYMRDEQGLEHVKSGRKILYPVNKFDEWAKRHSVNLDK